MIFDTTNLENIYSNNIPFDEATNLVNASLFYEHLERQIAQSRRDNSQFRIIRIILPDLMSELSLLDFASALNQSTRNEDVVSRIGRLEFVVLLRISQSTPDKRKWHEESTLNGSRHIGQVNAYYNNNNYIGTYNNNNFYQSRFLKRQSKLYGHC